MIKFIIAQGIGFSPGSVKYMPTLGFVSSGAAPGDAGTPSPNPMLASVGRLMNR